MGLGGMRAFVREWRRAGHKPYLIAPGGSSPLGVLGYVEAAFEIAAQVAAGAMPEPDTVVVPVGSCGTMAGLVLGMRLAGLRTKAVGVRIYDRSFANEATVAALALAALVRLRSVDRSVPWVAVRPNDVCILHDQFGGGYAVPTEAGTRAIAMARELEGIDLECTYSGKAMAGLIALMSRPEERRKVVLFVDTYSSVPLDALERDFPGPEALPPELRPYV
jgi:D-cysteine desulfhydrase